MNTRLRIKPLLNRLEPEIQQLKQLITDLAQIDSPYKSKWQSLKNITETGELTPNSAKIQVNTLVYSMGEFSKILAAVLEDNTAKGQYIRAGILDRCQTLQKNLQARIKQ
ncbi:hypothetical protein ACFORL_07860 [Legionella dresdenensis]|uniref:Coiled-coil protein n=1 Tax=Legionella dresdenensis TaxID=450200 RepID=A0ABV8CFL7_9GAMM